MFRTNIPVTADGFFNRAQELQVLENFLTRLKQGNPAWLAILGYRKIGKTSLLLELQRRHKEASIIFLILDTFEELPLSFEIFRRYAVRLLDGIFSAEIGVSLEALCSKPSEFRAALQLSKRFETLPPLLRSYILELPDRKIDAQFIKEALDLPKKLAEALNLYILVAWDEFQELAKMSSAKGMSDPLPLMRSIWQHHKKVAYIISGSERTMLTELVTEEHSPFFQHFSLMDLGPFSTEDAIGLLIKNAPEEGPIPDQIAYRAVEIIGAHPFYLQLLGEELTSHPPPYDEYALKESIQGLLFSKTGRLSLYFENAYRQLIGRSTKLAAVLKTIAQGKHRISDISNDLKISTGSIVHYIERLKDVIIKTEDGLYYLADNTFSIWLQWRNPGSAAIPMTVIGDEAEILIATHLARMGFDLVYQSRASRGAFDLLATKGPFQLGIQVKRTSLPLRIKMTDWDRMVAEAKRFKWKWILAVVTPQKSEIYLLNPVKAKKGKEMRLTESAAIDNLLIWLEDKSG